MTDHELTNALAAAFGPDEVKSRPGRGGKRYSYIDARAVAQRLDDVLGLTGWQFETDVADATRSVVHGRLTIFTTDRTIVREDYGYPNTDSDEEPLKSAASDAIKRCAVQVGVGRYLYGGATPEMRPAADPAAKRFEMAGRFQFVLDAIRAMDEQRAAQIEGALRESGASTIIDLPVQKAERAVGRAMEIIDELSKTPAEDMAE